MTRTRAVVAMVCAGVLGPVLMASAALAHEPVFVTAADPTPADGPFLVDGNHSWAVYGTLPEAGATRGFRSRLARGQQLIADLLVPDKEPERSLPPEQLPVLTITWPDGTSRTLESREVSRFDEPFSKTRYIRIAELREPASRDGIYTFSVRARAAARFTVATGTVEGFGGAKRETEPVPEGGLTAWYATPPVAVVSTTTTSTPVSTTATTDPPITVAERSDDDASGSSVGWWVAAAAAVLAVGLGVGVALRRRRR